MTFFMTTFQQSFKDIRFFILKLKWTPRLTKRHNTLFVIKNNLFIPHNQGIDWREQNYYVLTGSRFLGFQL